MDTFERTFAEGERPAEKPAVETPATEQPKAEETPAQEAPAPEPEKAEEKPAVTPGESKEPPKAEPEKPRIEPEQFKGYLEEREKRQKAEARAEALERQMAQQQQQPKEPPPDFYENPDGYRQHFEAQIEQRLTGQKMQMSELLAAKDHGAELVDKVKVWAAKLPQDRADQLIRQPSPFHAAVDAYRQEQALEQLKAHDFDIDKMIAARTAQAAPATPPVTQAATPPPANLPPKIAGEGGLVGKEPVITEGARFSRAFQ